MHSHSEGTPLYANQRSGWQNSALFILVLQYVTSGTDLRTHKKSETARDTRTTAVKTDRLQ
jgi:hypothetical protein